MYAKRREFFTLEDFEVGEVGEGATLDLEGRQFTAHRILSPSLSHIVGRESFMVLLPTTTDDIAQHLYSAAIVAVKEKRVPHVRNWVPSDDDIARCRRIWGDDTVKNCLTSALNLAWKLLGVTK